MYGGSESYDGARKANRLAQAICERFVADAPADLDEVMATIPRAPRWVGALVGASVVIGSWALIFLAASAFLH